MQQQQQHPQKMANNVLQYLQDDPLARALIEMAQDENVAGMRKPLTTSQTMANTALAVESYIERRMKKTYRQDMQQYIDAEGVVHKYDTRGALIEITTDISLP